MWRGSGSKRVDWIRSGSHHGVLIHSYDSHRCCAGAWRGCSADSCSSTVTDVTLTPLPLPSHHSYAALVPYAASHHWPPRSPRAHQLTAPLLHPPVMQTHRCSACRPLPLLLPLLHLLLLLLSSLPLSSLVAASGLDGGLEPGSHPPPSFDRLMEEPLRGAAAEGLTAVAAAAPHADTEAGEVGRSSASSPAVGAAALLSPRLVACTARAHPGVVRFLREAATFYPALDVHWTGTVPRLLLFASTQHRKDYIVDPAQESEEELMDRLLHPDSHLRTHTHAHTAQHTATACVCVAHVTAVLCVGCAGEYQRPLLRIRRSSLLTSSTSACSDRPLLHRSAELYATPPQPLPLSVCLSLLSLSLCSSRRRGGPERADLR